MVVGPVNEVEEDENYRLAAGCREGRKMSGGVADQGDVGGGGTSSATAIGLFSCPLIQSLNLKSASGNGEVRIWLDVAVPMKRIWEG